MILTPKKQHFFILLLSALSLGIALIAQFGFGLAPCVLCKYQRIPYILLVVVSFAGYIRPSLVLIVFSSLIFLTGAGIAGFHVGVEQGWWEGTTECGALPIGQGIEALEAAIMNAPLVRCTDIPWQMLGISMAGYNFLFSLGLGIILLFSGVSGLKKHG